MQPDDPMNPGPDLAPPEAAPDDPAAVTDATPAQPRLRRPAAFMAAKARIKARNEWLALTDEERAERLMALAEHRQDVRYQKARARLLAMVDDGAFALALAEAAKWMTRRGMRDLKRRSLKDNKDGRHSRWLLTQLSCAAAQLQIAAMANAGPDDPDDDGGPRVRIYVDGKGDKAPRGARRVRTNWARPGDLV